MATEQEKEEVQTTEAPTAEKVNEQFPRVSTARDEKRERGAGTGMSGNSYGSREGGTSNDGW